jgi:hypothetical protein
MKIIKFDYFETYKVSENPHTLTNQVLDFRFQRLMEKREFKSKIALGLATIGVVVAGLACLTIITMGWLSKIEHTNTYKQLVGINTKMMSSQKLVSKSIDNFNLLKVPVKRGIHESEVFKVENYFPKTDLAKLWRPMFLQFKHFESDLANENLLINDFKWFFIFLSTLLLYLLQVFAKKRRVPGLNMCSWILYSLLGCQLIALFGIIVSQRIFVNDMCGQFLQIDTKFHSQDKLDTFGMSIDIAHLKHLPGKDLMSKFRVSPKFAGKIMKGKFDWYLYCYNTDFQEKISRQYTNLLFLENSLLKHAVINIRWLIEVQ